MKWPKKPRPHDPFQLVFSSVAFARSQWHLQQSLSWQGKGFFFDGMARIVLARGMDGKVALGRACQPFARSLHRAVSTWVTCESPSKERPPRLISL